MTAKGIVTEGGDAKQAPVPQGLEPGAEGIRTASSDTRLLLAERVEAATGLDRELDCLIKEAIGDSWDYAADWGSGGNDRPVAKPYTASLDAAMTLVPGEERAWNVALERSDDVWSAAVWHPFDSRPDLTVGSTRSLALCAAALKARAVQ